MKLSIAAATLALGTTISAHPTATPAKFAIQITAPITEGGAPKTFYLGKAVDGLGVTDIKDAASCTITPETTLVCETTQITALKFDLMDMTPLGPGDPSGLQKGFFVKDDSLHWSSPDFQTTESWRNLPKTGRKWEEFSKGAFKKEGDEMEREAQWGLWPISGPDAPPQLWAQLGCPGGRHTVDGKPNHDQLWVGTNKIVAL